MEKRVVHALLSRIKNGTLTVTYWDGEKCTYGEGAPSAQIIIRRPGVLKAVFKDAGMAIGEAYMNGDIEIQEPFDNLLHLAENNRSILEINSKKWQARLHKNKKSAQAKFIAQHYDIGNDFYKLWLDSTMSYSCAYFHKTTDSLDQAQKQKIDHILNKLQIKPEMHLLDIGCGWGYLLVTAAKKYRINGTGVSLSEEQIAFAKNLAKQEGVDKLVTFKLANYQDLSKDQLFDRIVSVGFFEHVGRGNLADYFKQVQCLLKPGGVSVLHSITHQAERPTDPWLDKYIFPGGYIPSVRETTALLPDYDFYLFDYENLGQHYALTLEHWWKRFENHKNTVIQMYSERFYRMWRLYLVASMSAFKSGNTHLSQWTFKKGPEPSWPLTRAYLYKSVR